MKIVLDGMGGDFAPANVVAGLSLALKRSRNLEVFLVGIPEKLRPFLREHNLENDPRVEIVPASQVVMMEDAPAVCLRSKRDSSITVGSRLLKEKKAQTLVSAGHTGATVAATVVQNRTIPGIERPGIATRIPHEHGFFVLIDVGANPDSKPLHLAQYALLGQAYAKLCLGISHPRTGILSVGEEDHKGNELVRETRPILEHLPLDHFIGNVEGKHLFSGQVDVVLCDGFVGNVVLKCAESLAKTISRLLRSRLRKNPVRMAGAFLSHRAFSELREIIDRDEYGGAPLLGIDGNIVIAHGASSPLAIANAIRTGMEMESSRLNERIKQLLDQVDWSAIRGQLENRAKKNGK